MKMKEQSQKTAFEEMLETMAKNGGELPGGSVVELVCKSRNVDANTCRRMICAID
jgi:hypothetical protein